MSRDLFAGKNGRLKEMSAEDFADMMMADLAEGRKPGADYNGVIKSANEDFNKFMDKYKKGELRRSDVIRFTNTASLFHYLPNSKDILLKQSVINKAHKKHNISLESLYDLPEKMYHPILVFKSSREDVDGVVVLVDAKDNDGNNIIVAIDLNGKLNEIEVNDITSVYGERLVYRLCVLGEEYIVR